MNWRLAAPEHRFVLGDAEPSALFAEPDFHAHAEAVRGAVPPPGGLRARRPARDGWHRLRGRWPRPPRRTSAASGDLASPLLVVYTSGTTGRPKGAVLTQGALLWNALNSIAAHAMTSADHVLTVLPMFHVGGLNIQTTPAILAGATITLARRFDPGETLDLHRARRPTLLLAVPAVAQALSRHPPLRRRRSLEPARHVHRLVHRPRGGDPPVDATAASPSPRSTA